LDTIATIDDPLLPFRIKGIGGNGNTPVTPSTAVSYYEVFFFNKGGTILVKQAKTVMEVCCTDTLLLTKLHEENPWFH
jgi:hypothetical protein